MMIPHLHLFSPAPDRNEKPGRFTFPFHYSPHPWTLRAAAEVQAYLSQRTDWSEELHKGKMFGVLVVETAGQETGFLAAFSGNLAGSNVHPYFVPPVYDLLRPDGYFRTEEANISAINRQIEQCEASEEYRNLRLRLEEMRRLAEKELADAREQEKRAKALREQKRQLGLTEEEKAALIRESQFGKAELKRLKTAWTSRLEEVGREVACYENTMERWKQERKERSAALQLWLFSQFRMLDATGSVKDLCQLFADTPQHFPPAGAGECAAPKLLQYAYLHGLKPLAMGEFWWGASPKEEIRHHGHFYPSCKGKCEPILRHMLQGLDVEPNPLAADHFRQTELETVYEDEWIVVVNKPAGMLSVPGKNDLDSVYHRLRRAYPDADGPLVVHRLDMATSGLLMAAKTKDVHQQLQQQFEGRTVKKRYTALLEGSITPSEGEISLPMRLDPLDRPRQVVDRVNGKNAVTRYEVQGLTADGCTRIFFYPQTGRTHQLRVHAAHPEGLNAPIKGDELYGRKANRMYLHAAQLQFVHPVTGKDITITREAPF